MQTSHMTTTYTADELRKMIETAREQAREGRRLGLREVERAAVRQRRQLERTLAGIAS